ncbi:MULTISPECIES: tripartite tricarboxylate transporter permease [Cohnella]|uniref:tripartite tricarboxylate transporter permease n=1 Tax=Cohnella TaxID=329857 RepID=UPI0009BC3A09|nr:MULTISPECIES: tripartite tricarboxylate transporter permease [Cohnella]MBN2981627.1 tripartite tricarboxylate transporter permease [Cohnella algarum]
MEDILAGISSAFSLTNLLICLVGVALGTLVGVLPGLGPVGAISLLLPLTFSMEPTAALILVAGIYFGGMYGGSTTSILVNVPGEAASVVTTLDGYKMTQKGRAGAALSIAAIGSFVAGTIGMILLSLLAPPLARMALQFGPPEYFAIVLVGLLVLSRLTDTSLVRSYLLIAFGVVLSLIGIDQMSGSLRLVFDSPYLIDGLDFVPIIMGLYGMSEVLGSMEQAYVKPVKADLSLRKLLPTKTEMRRSSGPIVRGGLLGFLMGLIPGPANILSTYASYGMEKKLSKHPEEFGNGAIEGVAGPESANNGASTGALVPLLSLGVPFSPLPAILLSAFMIQGITPGPLMMQEHSTLFWALIASMYIGNVMLLILNLPMVGLFAKVSNLPPKVLMPIVMIFCIIGAYSVRSSMFDVIVLMIFGILGYLLRKAKMEPSPLVLGVLLGPTLENSLSQSALIFQGDLWQLFARPISGTLLVIGLIVTIWPVVGRLFKAVRSRRIKA